MKTMENTEKFTTARRPYDPPTLAMRHFSPQTTLSASNKDPLEDKDNWIYGDL